MILVLTHRGYNKGFAAKPTNYQQIDANHILKILDIPHRQTNLRTALVQALYGIIADHTVPKTLTRLSLKSTFHCLHMAHLL